LGLLAIIAFELAPLSMYAPFQALLLFVKFILEIVICEGVQNHLRFFLRHLNCDKMADNRKVALVQEKRAGWAENGSLVVSEQKFPW
jgi:hypothetical protein